MSLWLGTQCWENESEAGVTVAGDGVVDHLFGVEDWSSPYEAQWFWYALALDFIEHNNPADKLTIIPE
ncbi:MAG: hypothetical protein AB7U73_21780 [Pirellulales bacterium]